LIEGQEHDAGKDAEGRALWVVAINPDAEPAEEPDQAEGQDAEVGSTVGEDDGGAEDDGGGEGGDYGDDDGTREYWVGVFDDEGLVALTEVETVYFQNEDTETDWTTTVEITENRLRVYKGGYRGGRDWGGTAVYRLSPLRVIYRGGDEGWAVPMSSSEYREDLLALRVGNSRTCRCVTKRAAPTWAGIPQSGRTCTFPS
jgi:hypothetical protein